MQFEKNSDLSYGIKNTNIEIRSLRRVILGAEWSYFDIASPYSRIYVPISGEGTVTAGGEEIRIAPGKIYVIPAMLTHSVKCEHLEKLFAHISVTKPDGLDALAAAGRVLVLEDRALTERLLSTWRETDVRAALNMKLYLIEALLRAVDAMEIDLGVFKRYSSTTEAAIAFVTEKLSARLTIDDIARATHTSRTTLQKTFRDDVGVTVGKYVDSRLMMRAERELILGKRSIAEISDELGFCDRFYFSRKFSEFFGTSPTKYMKRNIK